MTTQVAQQFRPGPNGATPPPNPHVRWHLEPAVRLRVSQELESGRTLADLHADGRCSSDGDDDFWLIGDLLCEQPIAEALRSHVLGIEHVPCLERFDRKGPAMSPTTTHQPTGHSPDGVSLLRRHTRALALGSHVSGELGAGRLLFDILHDEPVRATVEEMPCLLDDLLFDERVRELLDSRPDNPCDRPVIVCYDGTPASQVAVDAARSLFPAAEVVILAIWEPARAGTVIRTAGHPVMYPRLRQTVADANARAASAAATLAQLGCERARRAGLQARPLTLPASSFEDALARVAGEWTPCAVVVGPVRRSFLARLVGAPRIDAGRLARAAGCPVAVASPSRPREENPPVEPRSTPSDPPITAEVGERHEPAHV